MGERGKALASPDLPAGRHTARPSIRDVARAAGTAVSTVSRALNDHPDVSDEKRRRIQVIAEELGYRQNAFARGLRRDRSALIALVANEFNAFNSEYYTQLLEAVASPVQAQHLELLLTFPHAPDTVLAACISLQRRGIVDGALVVSPSATDEEGLRDLQTAGFALVVINPVTPIPNLASVEPANVNGAYAATRHLLALGHRRISLLTYLTAYSSGRDRIAGYETALREAGIALDPALVAREAPIAEAVRCWLVLPDRPTGVLCFNDSTAYAVIGELAAHGLAVPGDVSVVGFGDLPTLAHFGSGLTTVHQPIAEVGKEAMRMLIERIAGVPARDTHLRLPTDLVVRGSTGPPRRP